MLKKVVVIGPESTGKSTLCEALAKHFQCPLVPEYARQYIDLLDRPYIFGDLEKIARGQVLLEEQALKRTDKLVICDTDLHVLKVWSEHKYGEVSPWILQQITQREYDLYLLTDIDIPWTDDPQREHPEPSMRKYFFDLYQYLIQKSGVPYTILSGENKARVKRAIHRIDELLLKIN